MHRSRRTSTGEVSSARRSAFTLDHWGSLVTIVLSAVALQRSVSYGLQGRTQVIGPGMFPAIVSTALLGLGLAWAWQAWRRSVPGRAEPLQWPDRSGLVGIGVTVLVLLVPALVFDLVDFRLTVFAICFVVLRFVFGSSLRLATGVGVLLSTLAYLGLSVGLGLPLPLLA